MEAVGVFLVFTAMLVAVVCSIWLVIIAFQDSFGAGLLYLFVPFYAIYFWITRWHDVKRALVPYVLSIVFIFGVALIAAALEESKTVPVEETISVEDQLARIETLINENQLDEATDVLLTLPGEDLTWDQMNRRDNLREQISQKRIQQM